MIQNDSKITLTFFGDMLCHKELLDSVYTSETETYDFKPCFFSIKKYLKDSDYVVGNLEVPLAGDNVPYSHHPISNGFNAPNSYLEALIDLGVNLFTTANNHCVDRGEEGLLQTIKTLDEYCVEHIGTYETQEKRDEIFIKDINGIKVAFLNYIFGINYSVLQKLYVGD